MGVFKAYDIRGVYNRDFNKETAYKVGFFLPKLLPCKYVVVGRDVRLTSDEIFENLCKGINDAGVDVWNIGLATTPMVYFATVFLKADASVQITASHNPKEYNGMKISRSMAIPVGGDTGLKDLERMVNELEVKPVDTANRGKIIEKDIQRCERLNELLEQEEAMVIHGDGRDLGLLEEEGIRNTQAFVALTGNAETNILACLTAKKLGVRKTVALVENLDYVSMAESLDIGTIINKKTIAASHIFQMLLDADVDNLRSLMLVDAEVAEFTAAEGSKVTKKPVKDLGLPFGTTIGGLVRNGVGMLVNGNSQIEAGDSVMVFCHETKLKDIEKLFKKNTIW